LKLENILVVGLDGAGKTTHARKLMEELAMQGIRTRYVYMRGYGRVFLAFPFLVLSRLLGFTKVHVLGEKNRVSEYRFFINKAFRTLWPWVSLVDSLLYSIVFRLTSLLSDRLTISDRSVIDTLVDIIADTRDRYSFKHYGRYFLNLIPKNSVVILLDVDERTALERKKDIHNLGYLKMRRDVYKKMTGKYGWTIIDTNADFNTLHRKFLSIFDLNAR
jgi:thymidylate kinase